MLNAPTAAAQPANDGLSPSVVLVLRLVSSSHVRPTTGTVVSPDGLILIDGNFLTRHQGEDLGEIVVLDGGGDIVSHGRPARVVDRTPGGKFAVLSVEGLQRPAINLSGALPGKVPGLHLQAFPPAEQIARGALPLMIPLEIHENRPGLSLASAAAPLPYVSGPLIDACGNLAGYTLTRGPQTMATENAPRVLLSETIRSALESLSLELPLAACNLPPTTSEAQQDRQVQPPMPQPEPPAIKTPDEQPDLAQEPEPPAGAVDGQLQEAPTEADGTQDIGTAEIKTPAKYAIVDAGDEKHAGTQQTDVVTKPAAARQSLWSLVPAWLYVLVAVILALTAWKAAAFYRLHFQHAAGDNTQGPAAVPQPASDEPNTTRLGEEDEGDRPRAAPPAEAEVPDINALPDGFDTLVTLDAWTIDSTHFRRFCVANSANFSIIIGRGDVDISIEHPAVSRCHMQVESKGESMTLSDLGSHNGTYVNGIPCLKGEVFFMNSDDEIHLGNLRVEIRVETADGAII